MHQEGTHHATLEEVDLSELGLGVVDVDVEIDYSYFREEADRREIGYSRGTPASGDVIIDGIRIVSVETETKTLTNKDLTTMRLLCQAGGVVRGVVENDGITQVILEDLTAC